MDSYTIEQASSAIDELFWDAIGRGVGYENAMEEVSDWIGNNAIQDENGSIDWPDDEVQLEKVLKAVFQGTGIPSSEQELKELMQKNNLEF